MKKLLSIIAALLLTLPSWAQEGSSSYNVLKLPASSHAAALGGDNISNIEDTPAAGWSNPALLATVTDKSVGLDFMTYNSGSLYTGAQFVKAFGERHTAAAMVQLLSYGSMDETDERGAVLGTFNPKDMVVGLGYSYLLSARMAGGATLKMTSQNYAGYTSFAMSVDLGLNYFDAETDLSVSATMKNVGAQLKSFYADQRAHLPFVMQLGVTKGLEHIPVRLNLTLTDLTRWKSSYYYLPADEESMGFGRKLLNHIIVGVDVLPTEYLYLAAGYNVRRAYELKSAGSSKLAGLTFGGGLQLKKFKFGISYAKYHVGNASFMANIAYSI